CTVADENGRIGWTIMGILPRRVGFDGRLPVSWADGTRSWDGWLDPGEVPEIIQPASGRIWTANARVVDEAGLAILGDGGYALGARARQIRDDLHALEKATEEEMLAVQLDDRAHYLSRWREFLLHLLTPEALQDRPQRREFRRLVDETWTGRASVDSVSFRLVRAFRRKASAVIFAILTTPVRKEAPGFKYVGRQGEGPLWELVTRRPENLLHPAFDSWEALLLRIVDATVEELLAGKDIKLADLTWGRRNTVRVNHPLGMALPFLGRWLNAPEEQRPGAGNMPRFQAVDGGASERMVVSPGHEEKGLFHMPGGQSGHFLSPHYLDGHRAWAEGKPTPFLPGPVRQTLILKPRTD
ncbi:MAG: penicillin acylase family protein, partial [Acidobacteriota bacterium]